MVKSGTSCRYADGLTLRFMSDRVAVKVPGLMDDSKQRLPMDDGTTFWGEEGLDERQPGFFLIQPLVAPDRAHPRLRKVPVIRSTSQGRNFVVFHAC